MENSLKGLILAAGIIITCVIISLGFYIAREAKDTASSGAGQINKLQGEFADASKTIYDGAEVSGSEVRNVIRKFQDEMVGVLVKTNKGNTYYGYHFSEETGELEEGETGEYSQTQTQGTQQYINPAGRFSGTLIRDANGAITGLVFQQK